MQQKDSHVFIGMQQDLSPTKFKPEFMCDAHNVRITPSDKEDTYLSLTNERGTLKVNLSQNLSGYYLGHCTASLYNETLNKDEDIIIVFCTNPGTNDNPNESPDSIYKITLNNDVQKPVEVLYNGNLNFSIEHPIETFFISEAIDINKVYWNDGYNQPRVINLDNVRYDSQYNKVDPLDDTTWILEDIRNTQFDFVSTLDLQEEINIVRHSLGGQFNPGTIQYAFSYYNKFGQQSTIFYVSPLQYIIFDDRGGGPDEFIPNSFKITISNWQSGFDYIRIYSIHRTTLNATPECRIVQDIDLRNINGDIVFVDDGQIGEFMDPLQFPYIGGQNIIAQTWCQKDNTLFLGNVTLNTPSISELTVTDNNEDINIVTYVRENSDNMLSIWSSGARPLNQAGFKCGEEYRFGFQAQYKDGSWSEPIWIKDFTIPMNLRPQPIDSDNVSMPIVRCVFPIPLLNALNTAQYKKVRGLCVFPKYSERNVVAQGIVAPTVKSEMNINATKSISSWFFRTSVPSTLEDQYPAFKHLDSVKDEFSLDDATKKFKAPSKDGKVTMTFTFDSSALQGQDIVAFEKVIPQNGEVYTHADINDAPQTVHIPKIGTTAKDSQTKEHIGVVGKKATLVDTVAYSNLVVGKEYTMKGKLMDKATGKPFTVDGKEITASKTFKADKKDGSVDLTYTFDSSALQGKDLVVFEDLYHNDINVASHADIKDEGQTVHYPGVHTTATDKNTKTHTGAKDEKETIVDMVKYTNVIPGKSYTITGTLMDKETGKPYTENGKEVTATKTFAAEKTEGEVELDYTVDTSALKEAKTFVVFEDLKYGDVTLVSHADLKDEGQSVNIPSGHTEAADSVTNDQVGTVGKKVTTVDHVIYKNLTPGETYTVKGTVMNPETGKALQENGKDITAEKTFTAKESDGTVDITFTYDSSVLKGKSIVVFEDVYSNDIPVIINEDLKDTKEYIYYPEIHTSASASGQKNDVKAGKIEITDTVSYKNLIPGKEYDLKGLLMDKTSGQPVKGLFGSVKGETKFTPKTADGSVEVKFSFDASQYAGKTVVVFEDLYHNDKPVTDHHDINDQAQSVSFAEASPKTGITGNKTTLIILIVCVAAAAGVICTVLHKKKTPDDTTKPEEKSKE